MRKIKEMGKNAIDIIVGSFRHYFEHNAPLLAAGLSFYALFSVAPLGIFMVTLARFFFNDAEARQYVLDAITKYSGADISLVVKQGIEATERAPGGVLATLIGIAVVIFGGHSIFVQMRRAMNIIIGVHPQQKGSIKATVRHVIQERLFSFLTMLILGVLLLIFTLLTLVLGIVTNVIQEHFTIPEWLSLARSFDFLLSFVGVTFIMAALYRILPEDRFEWSEVFPGAILVGAIFFILKILVSYYLAKASLESTYGTAGSVIALMVWVYFTAMLVLFGAELNQQITVHREMTLGGGKYPSLFGTLGGEDEDGEDNESVSDEIEDILEEVSVSEKPIVDIPGGSE